MFPSFLCPWASWLGILSCYFIVSTISLPLFYFSLPMGLWVMLLYHAGPLSISSPLLGFIGQHSCCASPFHSLSFLGPFTSLLALLLPWGFFLNPLGFLDPITTSLPLITFRGYWPLSQPNEFTNSFPGFLDPFTSYLPLIILVGLLAINLVIPAC